MAVDPLLYSSNVIGRYKIHTFNIITANIKYIHEKVGYINLSSRQQDTRSSAVAKRPCDCCMGQFWPNVTGRGYSAPNFIGLSSTTVM